MSRPAANAAQRAQEIDRLNRVLAKALANMQPPKAQTVTEWAEENRYLSPESSAEVGPWRVSRTPYLREPLDAFTDPKVRRIVLVSSSQVGKSELENNIIGYIIDQDPGSILFIQPHTTDAKEYSKLRIAPMIRDCPALRSKVASPKSRDSGNTILQKTYLGGILTLCGSTEAHALASKPIRYVIGDERDRWAASAGKEGDPWRLAMARQITFYNAKAVEVSTPTIKGHSPIDDSFHEGTMERWCVKCPHCGEYHDIRFKDIRYEAKAVTVGHKKQHQVANIRYLCPECACLSDEQTMKRQPAKWIAENPAAYQRGVRSFWLNSFVSPWAGWESSILEYLAALGSSTKLQVVYNTCFGELWEDRGDIEDEDSLLARREDYTAEVPDGVLVITCGVDTQDDRLEYELLGHGYFGETWGLGKGILWGRPDTPEVWLELDKIIDRVYYFSDGIGLRVSMTFVDEGGHFTQEVRRRCQERQHKKMFCIKGIYGADRPYTSPPKQMRIMLRQMAAGSCWQYQIGVDAGKQIIMDNLRVKEPGNRYCHFPRRDDYNAAYFRGLLSERLVYDERKKNPWVWQKIAGHERNEALDCRNYAMAAFKALAVDLEGVDRRLQAARGKGPDIDTEQALPAAKPNKKPRPQAANRKQGLDRFYDDW